MSLKWRLARVRAMSSREIAFRVGRAVRARAERWGLGLAHAPAPMGPPGNAWLPVLPRGFDAAKYVVAADKVLSGSYHVFAMSDARLGFPPQWNTDPKTGTRAPLVFGKSLDYRKSSNVGDIKYLWEINRHLELVTLAQAWHLTGEQRFVDGCKTMLDSWLEQSPYPFGVNWCSSLEHAMRLTNWSFAWHLLGSDDSPLFRGEEGDAFRTRWLTSIYQHCHFIAGHMSRHSSANNHLLGEATGLFIASTTWPVWDLSARWQELARAELEREAGEQTFADGVNREQAVWYHHAVADMMLLAGLVARANRSDFGAIYWQRLQSMFEFIASIMDVGGNVPAIGDADDGLLVRFDPGSGFDVYHSLLATGAVLFDRAEFKLKAGVLDDKTRWLLGDVAEARFDQIDSSRERVTLPPRREFPQGGYYVLGSGFETPEEVRIVADAGPLGYLSIAAHGHADALAFTLSAGGLPILIDPGTFAYHTERRWRDYFRGTSAHNTVRVDGKDQSVAGGTFLWLEHARAGVESFEVLPEGDRLIAHHSGYARLTDPVQHRRAWHYERAEMKLLIDDRIDCNSSHRIEWFWHFAPGCGVSARDNTLVARREHVTLTITLPPGLACRLETASDHPPLGWYSPGLDRKQPAITAVVEALANASTSWHFELQVAINSP
ncbi:MAG TPA: alginate lyase family protein [Steroidobacteraceae bacterium]|nr:alginate lyase family protein [Steroidobacteraceae bacterium]